MKYFHSSVLGNSHNYIIVIIIVGLFLLIFLLLPALSLFLLNFFLFFPCLLFSSSLITSFLQMSGDIGEAETLRNSICNGRRKEQKNIYMECSRME